MLGQIQCRLAAPTPKPAAPPTAEQLNAYRAALERAQAVARALAEAGVPANKIQTEAAPAGTAGGRVEIQLLP